MEDYYHRSRTATEIKVLQLQRERKRERRSRYRRRRSVGAAHRIIDRKFVRPKDMRMRIGEDTVAACENCLEVSRPRQDFLGLLLARESCSIGWLANFFSLPSCAARGPLRF